MTHMAVVRATTAAQYTQLGQAILKAGAKLTQFPRIAVIEHLGIVQLLMAHTRGIGANPAKTL